MSQKLTPEQVAERLGVTVKRIYRLIRSKRIDATDVSAGEERPRWRIAEEEIERFEYKSSSRRKKTPLTAA